MSDPSMNDLPVDEPAPPDTQVYVVEDGVQRAMTAAEMAALPTAADIPPPPIPDITRRQLLLALLFAEFITAEEAVAAAQTGAVPAQVEELFAQLPPAEAVAARITWATLSVCQRRYPLVEQFRVLKGKTHAEMDDFFRMAATL